MTREPGRVRPPTDPGFDRIAGGAAKHGFPVNILCWGNLDAGMTLIDRHPDTRFILDHIGIMQPRTPPAPPQPWADLPKVLDLAKRKNAVIKISGACTLSKEPYPFNDIWDPLARIFDADADVVEAVLEGLRADGPVDEPEVQPEFLGHLVQPLPRQAAGYDG